jgi:hypothetical protein
MVWRSTASPVVWPRAGDEVPTTIIAPEEIRRTVVALFEREICRHWYCARAGTGPLDRADAADLFLERARVADISPAPFFDPGWFRSKYRVNGVNSFLDYLSDPRQRLAWPSPLFWPRWYSRRHRLDASQHPFVHYLSSVEEQSPHPLLDVDFLREQDVTWRTDAIALEYIADPARYRLKPHPLFDSGWYLDRNPDVAEAGMNPLHHYLYHGTGEGRAPNRIFNLAWYRDNFLDPPFQKRPSGREPLSHYVYLGAARGRTPAPGLQGLTRVTAPTTEHGPRLFIECLDNRRNIYSEMRFTAEIPTPVFRHYMAGNPDIQGLLAANEQLLILQNKRLAFMYTPKCASMKIVYWWLEKMGLLPFILRFSPHSHSGLELYGQSQEYIARALAFDPARYRVYKFVRNPLLRAVSSFRHFLASPFSYGVSRESGKRSISFVEFLDYLHATDYIGREPHFRPQRSAGEKAGNLSPAILKLEDGLTAHFAELERVYRLPPAMFEKIPEVRRVLQHHTRQPRAQIQAGPTDKIPFNRIPHATGLLTPKTVAMICQLYRDDFDAYGYRSDAEEYGLAQASRSP